VLAAELVHADSSENNGIIGHHAAQSTIYLEITRPRQKLVDESSNPHNRKGQTSDLAFFALALERTI
jgi:hypothetical protein